MTTEPDQPAPSSAAVRARWRRLRPRLTVRGLMVAVAIVGLMSGGRIWLIRRAAAFRDRVVMVKMSFARSEGFTRARSEWLLEMWAKYERAARSPWLPVAPDPPEPR